MIGSDFFFFFERVFIDSEIKRVGFLKLYLECKDACILCANVNVASCPSIITSANLGIYFPIYTCMRPIKKQLKFK